MLCVSYFNKCALSTLLGEKNSFINDKNHDIFYVAQRKLEINQDPEILAFN